MIHSFQLPKPCGLLPIAGVGLQLGVAHALECLRERCVLNLDGLTRLSLGTVCKLLSGADVSFNRFCCESFGDRLSVGATPRIPGHRFR
jgi:hypothetical protein